MHFWKGKKECNYCFIVKKKFPWVWCPHRIFSPFWHL